jgi:hypothetical protein
MWGELMRKGWIDANVTELLQGLIKDVRWVCQNRTSSANHQDNLRPSSCDLLCEQNRDNNEGGPCRA